MEKNDKKLLPLKKRRYTSAFLEPITSPGELCFETEKEKWGKTEEEERPINGESFVYPPNKRFCLGKHGGKVSELEWIAQKAEAADLNALFDYIRYGSLTEPESNSGVEWVPSPEIRRKKEDEKKKKEKGRGFKSVLRNGWKKLRNQKLGLKKENVKELFGKFWTGNESFNWEIEHYTDPLAFP